MEGSDRAREVVERPGNDLSASLAENLSAMFSKKPVEYILTRYKDLVNRFTKELLDDPNPPANWKRIYSKPFKVTVTELPNETTEVNKEMTHGPASSNTATNSDPSPSKPDGFISGPINIEDDIDAKETKDETSKLKEARHILKNKNISISVVGCKSKNINLEHFPTAKPTPAASKPTSNISHEGPNDLVKRKSATSPIDTFDEDSTKKYSRDCGWPRRP